jgi:hypothetical protein
MAGKTFPGIGDLEDESPPLDPADAADSSGNRQAFYSGPTVVDEAKVEQGLKKLRSLDAPPGPLTGIHQAVADALSDPSRVTAKVSGDARPTPQVTIDPVRGTAIGRSVAESVLSQQATPPIDDRALRGTMFGHSIHVPDLDPPARKREAETSNALTVVNRGQATSNEIAVFQPGTYLPQEGAPSGPTPYPRSNRFRSTPVDLRATSSRKLVIRIAGAAVGIALIVTAALIWVHSNSDEADSSPRPTATVPPPPSRPVVTQPVTPPPPTAPVGAIAPPPSARTVPTDRVPSDENHDLATMPAGAKPAPAPTAALDAAATPTRHTHAPPTHSERRHSAANSKGDDLAKPAKADRSDGVEAPAPAKPVRGKRPVEDDPDATMAPTIE